MQQTSNKAMHYSGITAFQRCPRKFYYRYIEGLRSEADPLAPTRGTWMHTLLAAHMINLGVFKSSLHSNIRLQMPDDVGTMLVGEDVNAMSALNRLNEWWGRLPEALREDYTVSGLTLPQVCHALWMAVEENLQEFFDRIKPIYVEQPWERDGLYGTVDLVYQDEVTDNLGIVDWKTTGSMPDGAYRLMDAQLYLYAWGISPDLERIGFKSIDEVAQVYVWTSPPKAPSLKKDGGLSKAKGKTIGEWARGYAHYHLLNTDDAAGDPLKPDLEEWIAENDATDKYVEHRPMPILDSVARQVLSDFALTVEEVSDLLDLAEGSHGEEGQMESKRKLEQRVVDRSCEWLCEFKDLCFAELMGNDTTEIRERFEIEGVGEDDDG